MNLDFKDLHVGDIVRIHHDRIHSSLSEVLTPDHTYVVKELVDYVDEDAHYPNLKLSDSQTGQELPMPLHVNCVERDDFLSAVNRANLIDKKAE